MVALAAVGRQVIAAVQVTMVRIRHQKVFRAGLLLLVIRLPVAAVQGKLEILMVMVRAETASGQQFQLLLLLNVAVVVERRGL